MEINEIRDKARFFFEKKIMTHIDTKDNSYYNGLITEIHETFIVIEDRVWGTIAIAFSEVVVINKFRGSKK